jgi:hypothetical protein
VQIFFHFKPAKIIVRRGTISGSLKDDPNCEERDSMEKCCVLVVCSNSVDEDDELEFTEVGAEIRLTRPQSTSESERQRDIQCRSNKWLCNKHLFLKF